MTSREAGARDAATERSGADAAVYTEVEHRKAVRDRYKRVATAGGGCCGPSCGGDSTHGMEGGAAGGSSPEGAASSAAAISTSIGYSSDDLANLPSDANLGLGCGNPTAIAELQPGATVLDLGSGAGIDCFLAAKRVGPAGTVIGVDMTPEMVERARANAREGGYENVDFRLGEIEALPVADASVDVILSNCVLNLSTDKAKALSEAHRVLRPGGRIVISDMVSDRPVPAILEGNLDAVAACLPTLRDRYLDEFRDAGFTDVRITRESPYPVSFIMEDEGVRQHIEDHPDKRTELEAFAGSIVGAHFEATKV